MNRFLALALLVCASHAHAGTVLDAALRTHTLNCGVITEPADETKDDTHGDLSAFDGEICRAVAAATHATVALHAYPSEALGYAALQHGQIALMVGGTPDPGLARRYNVTYLNPVFFDGQGFMVHRDRGFASLRDLGQKHICFIGTTDAETRLTVATQAAHISIGPFPFEEIGEMEAALVGGGCDAETHDVSRLAADRAGFHGRIADFVILPDRLTLDPLAPVVASGDAEWGRVVDWVTGALVQAEIDGVTRANVDQMRKSPDPTVQTLAGARPGPQWGLFLQPDWSARAIGAVGNYGEIYARTIGRLGLERGVNRPWTEGGMLWGAPVR
jgi:general L-amino acid transport system substrate-binding protein